MTKVIIERADELAFLVRVLGVSPESTNSR